jgi:hypothetical protein
MKTKKRIKKSETPKQENKIETVMREFKEGKLKDSHGKTVTDKDQAIAISLSEAGVSRKSLEKSEILNKIRVLKAQAQRLLYKELAKDESIETQLIEYFKTHKNPNDSEVHALAEKLNISPHDLEGKIYSILSSFLAGGLSGGKDKPVDEKELEMGVAVESEHTDDKEIARKIATDHLFEDSLYYTHLKEMEDKAKAENR